MEYRKFGNRYLVRMDPGDEVLSELTELCQKEKIALGEVRALGAADDLVLGVYDVQLKKYFSKEYRGAYEITSLFGTITRKDGEVYLHLHLAASGADGSAVGGHLNKAVISGTLEMVVEPMEGHAERAVNPLTGLNDIAF